MDIPKSMITRGGRLKVSLKQPQFESKHLSSANDSQWERRVWGAIINHGAVTGAGFQVGELFEERTNPGGIPTGKRGYITAVTASSITYDTTHSSMPLGGSNNNFTDGATHQIVGLTSASSAVVTNHDTGTHHWFDYDTASVRMRIGTASGARAISTSIRKVPYFSGYEPTTEKTWVMAPLQANLDQYIIVGNRQNGVGIWANGTTVYFVIILNGVISNENKLRFDSWLDQPQSIDTMAQIFGVVYKWLGYDFVGGQMVSEGKYIDIVEKFFAGKTRDVFMRTPTSSVYYEIVNTGETSEPSEFRIVCSNISSEGGTILPGSESCVPPILAARERSTASTESVVPLILLDLAPNYPTGKPNDLIVRILNYKTSSRSSETWFELQHVHDAISIGVNAVQTRIDLAPWVTLNSGVRYLQGGTGAELTNLIAGEVHPVTPDYVVSGVGQNGISQSEQIDFINNHSYIYQNYESKNSQKFCVAGKVRTSTAQLWAALTYVLFE